MSNNYIINIIFGGGALAEKSLQHLQAMYDIKQSLSK